MPVMNGIKCLGELKKDLRFQSIPVIILTTAEIYKAPLRLWVQLIICANLLELPTVFEHS